MKVLVDELETVCDDGAVVCTRCGDRLERGQVVVRDRDGRHHEDCAGAA